jgi:8-oxo-dGTP diphosphatase
MKLDARTILVLHDQAGGRVLLLRRAPHKKLFPNLITGIGGKIELHDGEAEDIERSLWREVSEETGLGPHQIKDLQLRLSTILSRGQEQVVLFWFTGRLVNVPDQPIPCPEGRLEWFDCCRLPVDEMTPTGREAIPFIVSLSEKETTAYNGIYNPGTLRLTTNRPGRELC